MKRIVCWPFRRFRRLSKKRKILVILVLLIIAVLIFSQIFTRNATPPYQVTTVSRSDVVEVVSETGKISSGNQIEVYSPTNGLVTTVFVQNGMTVVQGEELMSIKSSATEQEKAAALATYLSAKNALDTAQAALPSLQSAMFSKWDTFKELAESDEYEEANGTPKYTQRGLPEFHIAEKDWLAAEANYKKQQAVISQAQAAVSNTYLGYLSTQDAVIKATADGIVANLSVSVGNAVVAKTPASAPIPLLAITNNAVTEAVVSLSETDIAKVQTGQEVVIDVNAVDNGDYHGIVNRVDSLGSEQSGVIRYRVYITISDADSKLRSGMTIDADITTKKLTDVLTVPNSAVKPYQGGRAVRVMDEATKQIKYLPVEIGIRGQEKTEIVSGLEEGQTVITTLSNEQLKRPGLFGN